MILQAVGFDELVEAVDVAGTDSIIPEGSGAKHQYVDAFVLQCLHRA